MPDEPGWETEADRENRGTAEALAYRLVPEDPSNEELVDRVAPVDGGDDITLEDVHDSLELFNRQKRVLEHLGLAFPCAEIPGAPLPVALPLGDPNEDVDAARARLIRDSDRARFGETPVRPYHPDEARAFVRQRLGPFLAPRIATATVTAASVGPGFQYRVETPGRRGLRIHYSPAYFFNPTNVFGNMLSTPVDGLLLPGRYVFGTTLPPASPTFDLNATYRVPGPPDMVQL
jgi:hypothetical protein